MKRAILVFLCCFGLTLAQEPIGTGGGGRMSRIFVSQHTPDLIYAGNDMGGLFRSTDGGENWHYLAGTLHGAGILDIAEHPLDPNIVYVQTMFGVERSTDGGETWELLTALLQSDDAPYIYNHDNLTEEARRLNILTIDPQNPSIIYTAGCAGLDEIRFIDHQKVFIYRSLDGGETWTTPSFFPGVIRTLVIGHDSALYAAGYYGVFKSVDGGETWQELNQGLPPEPLPNARSRAELMAGAPPDHHTGADVIDLILHPQDNRTMYALTRTHGVYKSTDSGDNWFAVNGDIELRPYDRTFNAEVHALFMNTLIMDQANPERLLLGLRAEGGRNGVLYETLDGGITWTELLRFYPENIAVTTQAGFPNSDAQRDFMPCTFGNCGGPVIDLAIDPQNPNIIYGANDFGLERLEINAEHTALNRRDMLHHGLLTTTPLHQGISVISTQNSQHIFAGGMDTQLIRSLDGGITWESMVTPEVMLWQGERTWFYVTSLAILPTQPETIYVTTAQSGAGGLYRSTDGGDSWTRLLNGLPQTPVADGWGVADQVVIDPTNSQTLYALYSFQGIFKSTDGGESWTAIHSELPVERLRFEQALAIDPLDPNILYLAPHQPGTSLFRSLNGGTSWEYITLPEQLGGASVGGTAVSVMDGETVIFVSGLQGIAMSRDQGTTWEMSFHLVQLLGDRVLQDIAWQMPLSKVVVHPDDPARLFFVISSWQTLPRVPEYGIYMSEDGGRTWSRLFDLPNYGGNINVSDDGRYLWQFSNGMDIWRYPLNNAQVEPLPFPLDYVPRLPTVALSLDGVEITAAVPFGWEQVDEFTFALNDHIWMQFVPQLEPDIPPQDQVLGWDVYVNEADHITRVGLVNMEHDVAILVQAPADVIEDLATRHLLTILEQTIMHP